MTGPLGNNEFCFPRISMFPSTKFLKKEKEEIKTNVHVEQTYFSSPHTYIIKHLNGPITVCCKPSIEKNFSNVVGRCRPQDRLIFLLSGA